MAWAITNLQGSHLCSWRSRQPQCHPTASKAQLQQQQQHWQCTSRRQTSSSSSSNMRLTTVFSLPRIADFIRDECPIRGLDGSFREQPAQPGTELQDSCVVQMHEESLLVPGQRQLMYVHLDQLERIITDQGRAVLACLQNPAAGDATAATTAAPPTLLSPARGSWSVAAAVGGVQRLPGSSRALVRLLVTDRVAVQALSSPSPHLVLARSAQLRDRWCYFVRTAALELHLSSSSSSSNGSSPGSNGAGSDVLNAVQQVQDAATELLQLLQQLGGSVQEAVDAADAAAAAAAATGGSSGSSSSSSLQQLLLQNEAAEELAELLSWCEMEQQQYSTATSVSSGAAAAVNGDEGDSLAAAAAATTTTSSSSSINGLYGSDGLLPADALLMERAWRLSFAPFAAKGLAAALGVDVEAGKSISVSTSSSEVLEMMDLGLRLEAAWELGQVLRQKLAARLSLGRLQS